jgi:hypothetical protein
MKTVFARALVVIAVLVLPVSALASTKATGSHSHGVAKKEPKKKGKHHGHKNTSQKPAADAKAS